MLYTCRRATRCVQGSLDTASSGLPSPELYRTYGVGFVTRPVEKVKISGAARIKGEERKIKVLRSGSLELGRWSLREYMLYRTFVRYMIKYRWVKIGSKNPDQRTDPSVGRSRVRECGTSGHAAAH